MSLCQRLSARTAEEATKGVRILGTLRGISVCLNSLVVPSKRDAIVLAILRLTGECFHQSTPSTASHGIDVVVAVVRLKYIVKPVESGELILTAHCTGKVLFGVAITLGVLENRPEGNVTAPDTVPSPPGGVSEIVPVAIV